MLSRRWDMVPLLSSAARTPLSAATSAIAVAASSFVPINSPVKASLGNGHAAPQPFIQGPALCEIRPTVPPGSRLDAHEYVICPDKLNAERHPNNPRAGSVF